jgi:hypothetical protein
MPKRTHILLIICLLSFSLLKAQDTLVGWTFPDGSKNAIANIGNELNLNGMFIEAAKIDELPFSSMYFSGNGYSSKSAASISWDSAKDLKCWKFSCDATGYMILHIFARVSSDSANPGPRDFKIQYRMGCCSPIWKDVPWTAPFKVSTDWTTGWVNNVAIPNDADSMAGFQVRFVCTSDTATDGSILKPSSKSMIDEVYVTGTKMTSINNMNAATGIHIYPNPASDIIHISSGKNILEYRLCDLSGKSVMTGKINQTSFSINSSDLVPGLYFIDLYQKDNYHSVHRVIIR